jgi:hypothetical protein
VAKVDIALKILNEDYYKKDGRYHATNNELVKHKFIRLLFMPLEKNAKYKQHSKITNHYEAKPEGFWYAFGDSWIDLQKVSGASSGNLLYEVDVSKANVLALKSLKDFDDLYNKFPKEAEMSGKYVDWDKVSKKYDGVEIQRLHRDYKEYDWYSFWDVPSGCIWNTSKITVKRDK